MQEPIEEQHDIGTEQDTGTEHHPDPPARPARSLVVAASVVVVALLALGWWQWGASDDAEPTEDLVAGDDAATTTSDTVDRAELEPAQVVVALLAGTGDRAARAELIEPGGTPDAVELVATVEQLVDHAAGPGAELDARTRWSEGALSVVDVVLPLGGRATALAQDAELRTFVLRRTDGRWQLTHESVCGLLAMAPMVGLESACSPALRLHRSDGVPDVASLMTERGGEPAAPTIEVGVWGDSIERTGALVWFVDYPEMRSGGGGPVGPAEVVAVDLVSGARVGAHLLEGTDARIVGGPGTSVWALHHVESDGERDQRLARVDAVGGVQADHPTNGAAMELRTSGDTTWLIEPGAVTRWRNGVELDRIEAHTLIETARVAATSTELWIGRSGTTTLVVDAEDGSVRELATPDGLLAGSADQIWSIRTGPGPRLQRLGADGSVLGGLTLPDHLEVGDPLSSASQVWGDGAGGLWLIGSAGTQGGFSYDEGDTVRSDVVQRPYALRIGVDGDVTETWWTSGSSPSGTWFRPVGDLVGLGDVGGLQVLDG